MLGVFVAYPILIPYKAQAGSFKKAYMSILPLLIPLGAYALERAVTDRRIRIGAMVLVIALAGADAFDAVRLDAQQADSYLAIIEQMAAQARALPDTNGDGKIILMTQDPYILRYVGLQSVMFPDEDRDTVISIARRYGVDYLLMPPNRPSLDRSADRRGSRSAFRPGRRRAGHDLRLLRDSGVAVTVQRWLWLILLLALALRLGFGLTQDPLLPYQRGGGDSGWYLANGYALVTGRDPYPLLSEWERWQPRYHYDPVALIAGRSPLPLITDVSNLPSAPLYLILIGIPQAFLDPTAALIALRILQAILSTATCYFAYGLARRLTDHDGTGLLAAFALAISPAFIVESAQIMTETVGIFLLTGGVWLYVESVGAHRRAPLHERRNTALLLAAAILLGLAALTRAVLLAFPFGLAIHLLLVCGWRAGLRKAILLLVVYALVVGTWTVYSVARWNRFVIAGEGLPAFLYYGATGWNGYAEADQRLAQESPTGDYTAAAESAITADPLGWIKRRVGELAGAYLQPHGTTFFSGESLRKLVVGVLHGDQSLAAVVQGDNFAPKLALYLFHYAALIGGLIGIWLYRRRWRVALPMIGLIAYLTLVHLALYALPRYLFPTEVFWWVFAAATLWRIFQRHTVREVPRRV